MATATWPGTLPQKPTIGGWTWAPQNNKVSFRPDIGPAVERRRGTAVSHDYNAGFPHLSSAQVAIFETFYQDTLKAGTLHYLWNDPVNATSYKWKIESYQINSVGGDWFGLTMKMHRLPGAAV